MTTTSTPIDITTTTGGNPAGAWDRIPQMRQFWPVYLAHHRDPRNRAMHDIGGWIVIAGSLASIAAGIWLALGAVVLAYGFAFAGHLVFERNTPLTLERPLLAAVADVRRFVATAGGLRPQPIRDGA